MSQKLLKLLTIAIHCLIIKFIAEHLEFVVAMPHSNHIIIIGAGIGGLTAAALLAQAGYKVTVLEAQTYAGGCAGTFTHQGYRFDAGATVVGGFQHNGPHDLIAKQLNIKWPVQPYEPAWVVHLPEREIALSRDNEAVLQAFPESVNFWKAQSQIADLGWSMAGQGLPWPPTSLAELSQLARIGLIHFPNDLLLLPLALQTTYQWIEQYGLARHSDFVRFLDAQLLISAQTTSQYSNALYSAIALDLARQGVYHVHGGIGGIADTLVAKIRELGGDILFRQRVSGVQIENGKVTGVRVKHGRHSSKTEFLPCDFLIANLTPQSLEILLTDESPPKLLKGDSTSAGWGAFVLHLGVEASRLPQNLADHHQIIATRNGALGEGRSLFISLSPTWDTTRAPPSHRAVTVTTHTQVQLWWDAMSEGEDVYEARKQIYAQMMLSQIERVMPGFHASIRLILAGSPLTYHFYTGRHMGMVGGFPQISLFRARSPHTGIRNMRLVGDSIFPGQSTAGVTLGAIRVMKDVIRSLPIPGIAIQALMPDRHHIL